MTSTAPTRVGNTLAGRRIAVTGASGFCGAAVARLASRAGAEVVCLGRRPGPVGTHRYWDAATGSPDLAGTDVVVHLAAAVGDPRHTRGLEQAYRLVNVDGAARLLDAAAGRPVVWVSSSSVYSPDGPTLVTEEHPIGGQVTAYGRTKAEGERLALAAGAVVLRPRAVYGHGDPHLLPRIRRAVRAGVAPLPGPDVRLSLTHVDNLADACLAGIDWPPGAYNIADAEPYWRDAAIRALLTAVGIRARVVHVPLALAVPVAAVSDLVASVIAVQPTLTRYAVVQVSRECVLDLSKATAQHWRPRLTLPDFLAEFPHRP